MSDSLNTYEYYSGLGSSSGITSSLPLQYVSYNTKNSTKWQKATLDALEQIGLIQLKENLHFEDFYKMLRGNLVYSDYGIEDFTFLNQIKKLADDVEIPTFVKHYDIIGIMVRQIVGEWLKQRDNFRVDSTSDEIGQNEFLREQSSRIEEYTIETTKKEIEIALIKKGFYPKDQFTTEEEKQQYLEQLEAEKAKIIPPEEIKLDLSKNFRTKAAEWGEFVIETDQERCHLDLLDRTEMEDKLLTGRYFRHYHVGYDYYKPERWRPSEVFFSKDVDAQFPQDGEYVGRVFELSSSDIVSRYGHKMTAQQIKSINRRNSSQGGYSDNSTFREGNMSKTFMGTDTHIPFDNYFEYDLGLQYQDALNIPMGRIEAQDSEGNTQEVPTWLSNINNSGYTNNTYSQFRRDDFSVREDLLQVTEAYWRSFKKMWYIYYISEDGQEATEIVNDQILPEWSKDKGIKKVTTKSLDELSSRPLELNTMYEFWIPEVWKGIKISAGKGFLETDIYLDVAPLPYQLRGDSNTYDVKLPVAGFIGDSLAQRVRPYQIGYNVCLNQIFSLLEKEIGMFFLFDINFLPSEYKDHGTIEDSLEKLRDLAKDIGLVPLDTKKQNMEGANQSMNTFMVQDVTFDKQINSRIQLAEYYFKKALEQVGITDQRRGQSTIYETATGVQQGVEASYDQTADIFTEMSVSRKKSMELHLTVAQYCQKNYIDQDFIFTASDGSKAYMNLTDPDFPLRRLGLLPTSDAKGKRTLEQVRNRLYELNTMGTDLLGYAEVANSDTMLELISVGKRLRKEQQEQEQAQRQHEKELLDKELQAQAQEKQKERDFIASEAEKDRETRLEEERISALGRASDKKSDQSGIDAINEATKDALNNNFKEREIGIKENIADNKIKLENKKLEKFDEELKLKLEELELKKKKIDNDRYIATINKN